MDPDLKEFATTVRIAAAARELGICIPKLRKLAKAGLVGYVMKGSQMHFRQRDLAEFARQSTVPAYTAVE